ncbi:MAG TPA: plastocyanin/azurin family copper-binding protein [Solirubrobacter sp.]|jgi:plastocyanin|nr:plastocyanin/azurin family copper-binding protein [Solirubrobacter sp.]
MEPAEQSTRIRGRRALAPALTILITAAVVATAGVAGADEDTTIYVSDDGGPCFTLQPGNPPCGAKPEVTITTGDTVTWDFTGSQQIHNVADGDRPFGQERYKSDFLTSGTYSFQFGEAGTYRFVCQVHSGMEGTLIVEGAPVETRTPTPTPTPSATAIATATPVPTASGDDHTETPAPGKAAKKDAVAPRVRTVRLTGGRRAMKIRFWLSERATVTIRVQRRKSVVATRVVQAPAGTRTITLRDKRFKRGTYRVALRATDAMGNRSTAPRRTLRLRTSR